MDLFNENNWDRRCSGAINFKSNYANEESTGKSLKKSKAKGTKTKVENGNIKKNKKLKKTLQQQCNQDDNLKNLQTVKSSSKFADKLRDTLKGSRFRFINEQLYTIEGSSAKTLFEDDPKAFDAYHEGYKSQVKRWPLNPLDKIIKDVKKMPINYVIADFGCGEGRLSQSVPNKVYSLDLVSCRDDIIACDMANTPLKSESVDIVVFCLSLMGTNLFDFILEANRVLRTNGMIYIAEIASRFDNVNEFLNVMKTGGFEIIKKDLTNKLFYFFICKKITNVCKDNNVKFTLKPCLYKKR